MGNGQLFSSTQPQGGLEAWGRDRPWRDKGGQRQRGRVRSTCSHLLGSPHPTFQPVRLGHLCHGLQWALCSPAQPHPLTLYLNPQSHLHPMPLSPGHEPDLGSRPGCSLPLPPRNPEAAAGQPCLFGGTGKSRFSKLTPVSPQGKPGCRSAQGRPTLCQHHRLPGLPSHSPGLLARPKQ